MGLLWFVCDFTFLPYLNSEKATERRSVYLNEFS